MDFELFQQRQKLVDEPVAEEASSALVWSEEALPTRCEDETKRDASGVKLKGGVEERNSGSTD